MPIPLPIAKFLIRTGIAQRMPAIKALVPAPEYLRFYSDRILTAPNEPLRDINNYLGHLNEETIDLSLGAPAEERLRPELLGSQQLFAGSAYPPAIGMLELRRAVAEKLARDNGIAVDPSDEVSIVNGVSQAIHVVFDTFVNPGDKIAMVDPTFLVYPLAAQYHRARVAWIPSWLENGRTRLDRRGLERAVRGAKLMVVNSPSNPTGGVLEVETLERILALAKKYDALILSDEVYERFQYDGQPISIASLPGARDRTITVNSFSKSHAMAGCRVGYMAAIRHLLRPTMTHQFIATPFVPVASQRLAIRALSESSDRSRDVLAQYDARRKWLHRELCELGLPCDMPAGAFYLWIPIRQFGLSSLEFASRLLTTQNVMLMPGESFGPAGRHHIRISYAASTERLEEGSRRLAAFLGELRGEPNMAGGSTSRTVRVDSVSPHAHGPNRTDRATRERQAIRDAGRG